MSTTPNKIFIARLLGLDVFDPLGDRLGRLRDVVVLKRSFGTLGSFSFGENQKGKEPLVVGIVIEVLGKKRIFVPMTRITSIDSSQIICTGLVNLRRFEQRGSEAMVVAELFDRKVRLTDGSGEAMVEDVAMEQRRNGDWFLSELFVSRAHESGGLLRRRKDTLIIDWHEAQLSADIEPQAATAFVANHEDANPADLADAIHEMNDKRMVEIAHELQDERLADVLQELPEDDQVEILSHLDVERAAQVLEEMEADDAADLLNELSDTQREELLKLMDSEDADDVRRLLEYEEGTAGSLMNPVPIVLSPEATVAEALAHIRQEEISPALAAAVLVTRPPLETPTGKYLGMVHMQRLLRYAPSEQVGNLLDTSIEPVSDMSSLEELSRVLATYDLTIVPVVNQHDRLVGAVTIDDVLDALLPEDWRTNDDGTPIRKVGRRFE
ncbi:magnesium transporter MgtE N-terminal domain-containing protein [Rothia aerolata]|uniref:Magnesium transporter n=1 Tax=Rothia aerolata TaxID=1812262 RepID=A0A917IQV0_9MICC|nr:CBS domain-containing protein [Rothia aerolata]GGH59836.1 magnesium transporter [Rothia aerolata]